MTRTIHRHRLIAICMAISTLLPNAAIAQETLNPDANASSSAIASEENLDLLVGDIVEILPSTQIPNPTYSWILTQDRTFVQAARSSIFRIRLVQPGNYTLLAEIAAADGSARVNRTFIIHAKARTPGDVATTPVALTSTGTISQIVATDPPIDQNGHVIMKAEQQLMKLTPVNPDLKPLSLDLDTTRDADGNGNTQDDVDDRDTFFQAYATPLYVWFASPLTATSMGLTTIGADGNAMVQKFEVDSAIYAAQQGFLISPVKMTIVPGMEGTYAFGVQFLDALPGAPPLLYHWDFGDGSESLLMNPSHNYTASGAFTVQLIVKNLLSGKDIATATEQISVAGSGVASASSVASTSSAATSQPSTGGNSSILSIVWLGLLFLVFVIVGGGIVWIVSKLFRGKSLEKTFEEMEKNIVDKDGQKTPPPLTIAPVKPAATQTQSPMQPITAAKPQPEQLAAAARPAPTKEEFTRREENAASSPKPAATPRIEEAAAPSWLKKGLDMQPPVPTTPTTPAAPKAPSPVPAPSPVEAPKPVAPAPVTPPVSPVPPKAPTPPTPVPPPVTPKPVAPPVPAPSSPSAPPWLQTPAPLPKPVPAPAPTTSITPPTPQAVQTPVPPVMPKPMSPPTPPAPTPVPVTSQPATIVEPPKPLAPVFTPPAPVPTAPVTPAPVPAASQQPAPTPAMPQPILPAEVTNPPASDEPIAIIRAESLDDMDDDATL